MLYFYLKDCKSTNDSIIEYFKDDFEDFCCIYTFNQTSGRGQSGNSWNIEPCKNVAISFLVKENKFLNPNFLSFFIATKLRSFLYDISKKNTFIKWPNDIIIENKKVAGILIEKKANFKNNYVIGIGINVNQEYFVNLPKASSLKIITNKTYDLHSIANELQKFLTNEYSKINLDNCDYFLKNIIDEYNSNLYKKNQICVFKFDGKIQNGIIKNVDIFGNLILKTEQEYFRQFKTKDLEMMF